MKIIKHGNPDTAWWIGRHVTCHCCGEIVELEKGDQRGVHLTTQKTFVDYWCRPCQVWTTLHKEQPREALDARPSTLDPSPSSR